MHRFILAALLTLVPLLPCSAAEEPKAGEERSFEIANGVKMVFCWIPAGEAQLGSPEAERDAVLDALGSRRKEWSEKLAPEAEEKRGKYKTKGYWLGKYEVTQEEWQAVTGKNPSLFQALGPGVSFQSTIISVFYKITDTSRFPVECVDWEQCQPFLEALNKRDGADKVFGKVGKFRLPHEDEWEYACRGGKGNGRAFYWGDSLVEKQANFKGDIPFRTKVKPGFDGFLNRTCAVDDTNGGKYEKHPWGLMHMIGNVAEWCDTKDGDDFRINRGGSWQDSGLNCRSACRASAFASGARGDRIGLRVCLPLE